MPRHNAALNAARDAEHQTNVDRAIREATGNTTNELPNAYIRSASITQPASDTYIAYLASAQWRNFRQTIIDKRGNACKQCGRTGRIQLHHLTYARLGHELDSDVKLLCSDCHRAAHAFNATAFARGARRGRGIHRNTGVTGAIAGTQPGHGINLQRPRTKPRRKL